MVSKMNTRKRQGKHEGREESKSKKIVIYDEKKAKGMINRMPYGSKEEDDKLSKNKTKTKFRGAQSFIESK